MAEPAGLCARRAAGRTRCLCRRRCPRQGRRVPRSDRQGHAPATPAGRRGDDAGLSQDRTHPPRQRDGADLREPHRGADDARDDRVRCRYRCGRGRQAGHRNAGIVDAGRRHDQPGRRGAGRSTRAAGCADRHRRDARPDDVDAVGPPASIWPPGSRCSRMSRAIPPLPTPRWHGSATSNWRASRRN